MERESWFGGFEWGRLRARTRLGLAKDVLINHSLIRRSLCPQMNHSFRAPPLNSTARRRSRNPFLLRTKNVPIADPPTSPAPVGCGSNALPLFSNDGAAFTAFAALSPGMAIPRSRLRHGVTGGQDGQYSQDDCQDRFHRALLWSASYVPSVTALFQGLTTHFHGRMQERANQLLFSHIRVSRVFGYAPCQDMHAVELETVLDRKPFKEAGSEHLPYLKHFQQLHLPSR